MATTKEKILLALTRWLPIRISAGNKASTDDAVTFTDEQIERALVDVQKDGVTQQIGSDIDARYRFNPNAPTFIFDGFCRRGNQTLARLINENGQEVYFTKTIFAKYLMKV